MDFPIIQGSLSRNNDLLDSMRKYLPMERLTRIWKDPVWSKVIATGIIAFITIVALPYFPFLLKFTYRLITSSTSIPNWLLALSIPLIILVLFLYKKFFSKNKFKIKAEKCIPQLSISKIELLNNVIEKPQKYNIKNDDAIYLEQRGYIKRIDKVSDNLYLYEIDTTAKKVLAKHLEFERKIKLTEFIAKITEDEKNFLRLFFIQKIPYGTSDSGVTMEANIFSAGENMARHKIIKQIDNSQKSEKVSYELTQDAAEYIDKFIFNSKPKRFKVELDDSFIYVSHARGGMAKGAWG